MRAFPTVPPLRLGVFGVEEAEAAGWTRSARAAAVRRGDLEHVRRGFWAPALDPGDPGTPAVRLARRSVAASLATPGSAVTHLAAATADGLPTWAPRPRSCVTEAERQRADADGVHRHRAFGTGVGRRSGVLISDPARTVCDIAREHGAESALVTADAALAARVVTAASLLRAALDGRGWPGSRTARLVADLADPRSESPLESRSRWQMRRHDVPAPRTQAWIYTLGGRLVGRGDFFWEEGVVGEADGNVKYERDPLALTHEKWRQEDLERCRLRVVRWGTRDLHPFDPTADRIRARLREARADDRPKLWVVRYRPAW